MNIETSLLICRTTHLTGFYTIQSFTEKCFFRLRKAKTEDDVLKDHGNVFLNVYLITNTVQVCFFIEVNLRFLDRF